MKLSSTVIASLCMAVSYAQAIRGKAKQPSQKGLTEAEFGSATVILSHVSTPGKWNNKVVSDAFKKAYNGVHNGEGAASIDWTFVDTEVEVPEDDARVPGSGRYWESSNWCRFKYACPDCSPEDKKSKKLLPPMMTGALDYPDLHAEFETTFCKLIIEADPVSFGEVSKCQIDFTYSLSDSWGHHDHEDDKADYTMEMRGELDLSHVLEKVDEDPSLLQSRVDTMGNCFLDTYNMVHADGPYTLTGFKLERQVEVDEVDDEDEENDDGDKSLSLSRYYLPRWSWSWFRFQGGCRLCAPDDRKFIPPLMMSRLTMGEHQAFEATFANCLRESGLHAFSKIRSPHIRFTYTGEQEAM